MTEFIPSPLDAPEVFCVDGVSATHHIDYAHVLTHGVITGFASDGTIRYKCAGPWHPLAAAPGYGRIVLTSGARERIERAGLQGAQFRPVKVQGVVRIDWRSWNEDDWQYPSDLPGNQACEDEPEDYLRIRPSPSLKNQLGEVWELTGLDCRGRGVPKNLDIFASHGSGRYNLLFLSQRAAEFFRSTFSETLICSARESAPPVLFLPRT